MHKDVRGLAFSLSQFLIEVAVSFSGRAYHRNGNTTNDSMRRLQNREDDVMKMKNADRRFSLPYRWLAIALLTTGTLLNGCAQDGEGLGERTGRKIDDATSKAGESVQDVQKSLDEQTQKAGEYITDMAIAAGVKTDLLNDSLLALSNIYVTANAGVVTLSGTVDSQQAMDRAVEIAGQYPNVKSVENKLVIKAPGRL